MAGEVRIGGTSASVRLQGNDGITSDQTFTFPDTGGEMVVTPGTADIETTGKVVVDRSSSTLAIWQGKNSGTKTSEILADGSITAAGRLIIEGAQAGASLAKIRNTAGSAASNGLNIETSSTGVLALDIGYDIGGGAQQTCTIQADGSITAASGNFEVTSAGYLKIDRDTGASGVLSGSLSGTQTFSLEADGTMRADRELTIGTWTDNNVPAVQVGKASATTTGIVKIKGDGSNNSALSIRANGNSSSAEVGSIKANGDAAFRNTRSANVFLEVDRDNPDNFVSTMVDGEEQQVYSGPVLNVREILLNLQSKVQSLEAEIETLKGGAS